MTPAETLDIAVTAIPQPNPFTHAVTEGGTTIALFANSDDAYEFRRRKTETPDQAVDRAMDIIRRDYHDDVHNAAVSIQEELRDRLKAQECGESLREWLIEHIDQEIDGSARVMYTRQAQLGVLFSDNDGAYFEEFGDDGAVADGAIDWSKLCYAAMRADVVAELERLDVDVNSPVPECGECGADDQEERYLIADDDTNIDGDFVCAACRAKAAAIEFVKTLTLEQCRELITGEWREDETVETLRGAIVDAIAAGDLDPAQVSA